MIYRASELEQNSNNFKLPSQNCVSLEGKNVVSTTINKSKLEIKNQPMILDGIFWNVNHFHQIKKKIDGFSSLDSIFEDDLLREHLVVLKVALFTYFSNLPERENSFQRQSELNAQFWSEQLPIHKDSYQSIDNFLNQLRDSREFKELEILILRLMLTNNPQFWRIFQRFTEIVFPFFKHQLCYLIFKGLQLYNKLNNQGFSNYKNLLQYIEQNFSEICIMPQNYHSYKVTMPEENEENFKKMSEQILYTVVLCAKGQSKNALYQESLKKKPQQVLLRSRQLGSNKNFQDDSKISKPKKTLNLRRSITNRDFELGQPRKRHQSNDQ